MLPERSRERFISLIGRAYTSISLKDFAAFVGLPENEAVALTTSLPGWKYDLPMAMVLPQRPETADDCPVAAMDQLQTLTDFVAFLEK